jgi:hypothetical protein
LIVAKKFFIFFDNKEIALFHSIVITILSKGRFRTRWDRAKPKTNQITGSSIGSQAMSNPITLS